MFMSVLIFATNNKNKVAEIKSILDGVMEVCSLSEAGINIDIPEPHPTLEANASEKSNFIYRLTGKDCFSEDTGLEVEGLNGAPGVKSARYAGDACDNKANIDKLLFKLKDNTNKKGRFRTIISLIIEGKEFLFEGICEGRITDVEKGNNGFGYDAIFIPDGSDLTFAEMDMAQKNNFSHRKKAIVKLIYFLTQVYGKN
jgi:XTP/dITP diphosphohydrolase